MTRLFAKLAAGLRSHATKAEKQFSSHTSFMIAPRQPVWMRDPDAGVRKLQSVDLWEISLVTTRANAAAQVTVVKSDDEQLRRSGAYIRLADTLDRAIIVLG